jgi:uncharacterized membrane protein YfcA
MYQDFQWQGIISPTLTLEKNRINFTKILCMSRNSKLIIGLLSFLPIILCFILLFMVLRLIPTFIEWDKYEPSPHEIFGVFGPVFMLGIFLGILSLGLLIFFVMHLVRNKTMDSIEKIIWILVFLFAGIVGYPIYWYMRVWKNEI